MTADNPPRISGSREQPGTLGADMVPPYIAFHRFDDFLKSLQQEVQQRGGLPVQIARNMMSDVPHNEQGLLLRALRFFGFLDYEDGSTAQLLQYLQAPNEVQRDILRNILQERYHKQLPLLLEGKHEEVQSSFPEHLSSSVRRRCSAFLTRVAEKAGFEIVSPRSARRPAVSRPVEPSQAPQPMETHLPLGWGRECVLRHDGALSLEDIEHIKGMLDMLARRMKGSSE